MIRAVIIDDEQHCIDRLQDIVNNHCDHLIQIEGTFTDIHSGTEGIYKLRPDLVFLDVQLSDGTGFDLLSNLKEKNFAVIFTTAFDNYAVQAFRFSALDYLLKPIDHQELLEAVNKLHDKISKEEVSHKLEVLFHNLKATQNASKRISIPTINGMNFIQVNEIIRCQGAVNYTILYLKEKQKITVAKTLKEFEELLSAYNFYRVHNSHLINLSHIKSYNKGKGGSVIMNDDSEVEVSTRRKEEFLKKLSEL